MRLPDDPRAQAGASPGPLPRPRTLAPIEGVLVVLLIAGLLLQALGYPFTDDPDPDSYVSYANHILETGSLHPGSTRLPGYPAFLALVSLVGTAPLAQKVYWVQLGLAVLFVLGAWAAVRHWVGALAALLFLTIVAAPNYFIRMSVTMLPDVLYSALLVPLLVVIGWWTLTPTVRGRWLWLLPLVVWLFVAQAIRPTTFLLTAVFGPSLALGYLLERRLRGAGRLPALVTLLVRLGAVTALAFVVFVAADRLLDTGARTYNANTFAARVVVFLPPASDSPEEQQIEAAKRRFQEIEGQPIESDRFLTYPRFRFYEEMPAQLFQLVWRDRLLAHPGQYLLSVVQDLRLGHYFVARRFVPYFPGLDQTALIVQYFPRDDGSPASQLFRATGIIIEGDELLDRGYILEVAAAKAVLRLLAVWGLTLLGVLVLARRSCALVVAFAGVVVLFTVITSATNTVDMRYLLPFAVPIYIAQAAGLTWIFETVQRAAPSFAWTGGATPRCRHEPADTERPLARGVS